MILTGAWLVYYFGPGVGPGVCIWACIADTASLWLYSDDAYTSTSLKAADQTGSGVQFVVGDFNHNAPGVYYPRVRRTTGTTQGYDRSRPAFFVIPVDKGNNERCFVITAATKEVTFV